MQLLFPQWVISTCPKMHPDISFVSNNCEFVLGFSPEYLKANTSMDKYFRHVHEADQADLLECYSFLHELMEPIPPGEHHLYRFVFHYRFRKGSGHYVYLQDEKANLHLAGSGNLYYVLLRDISEERRFSGVKVEVLKQLNVLTKMHEYKPSSGRTELSKRERELLTLIKQGLSTKEIAWYLKISQFTVRNIKSRMFEKYNVTNSIELLNMAS
jgi:DNA-binding CsgD family transcriptional regulator